MIQPDEGIIKGEVMKRRPSSGWTFVVLNGPGNTMRLEEQPEPREFLHFHRAEEPDADAIVYTLVGKDDERSEAYYLKGHWGFGDQPLVVDGPTLEA